MPLLSSPAASHAATAMATNCKIACLPPYRAHNPSKPAAHIQVDSRGATDGDGPGAKGMSHGRANSTKAQEVLNSTIKQTSLIGAAAAFAHCCPSLLLVSFGMSDTR